MMMQILAAVAGTVAFSLLFGVPRRYYPLCGLIGGIGWAVYVLVEASFSPSVAAWIATMAVIFLSRLGAIGMCCPATIFLIPGIFPLVPEARVYWMTYYIVTDELYLAAQTGYSALRIAVAIVLGIVFVFEIPQSVFCFLLRKRK